MKVYEKEMLPEITTIPFEKLEEWYAKDTVIKRQPIWVRFFDLLFAIIGALFAFVPMLIIALAIKFDSRGPTFFIQERLGHYKRPIWVIKFRTMVINAEKNGPVWANENDNRITRVGYILRKTRLDELPQLFNILIGNLSFVGPRPIRKYFADKLRRYNPEYDKRFLVKPGLSGWAQIFAPYGSTIEEQLTKLPYDLKYLKGFSVKDYFVIILLTIKTVLMGNGV
jgi:lipopolysaccharide/colanic/teichoic acid biosynthesis glycosyltransferase